MKMLGFLIAILIMFSTISAGAKVAKSTFAQFQTMYDVSDSVTSAVCQNGDITAAVAQATPPPQVSSDATPEMMLGSLRNELYR